MKNKLVFLHIPKTAGQAVHAALQKSFGENNVSKIRINSHFEDLEKVNDYQEIVYSGHIDWEKAEKIPGDKVYFTILREPTERILSYYHYIRSEASKLDDEELNSPNRIGMKKALKCSPNEYFCSSDPSFKKFIDSHYDNFYVRFFSKKRYNNNDYDSEQHAVKLAMANLNRLDAIYTVSNWGLVSDLIKSNFDVNPIVDANVRHNVGDGLSTNDRLLMLHDIGEADLAIKRIKTMVKLDNIVYNYAISLNSL
ncbi:sulfotransferase family 2 domain-containing protein [Cobetia sp. UIB-001]|uniref:sulfotransferase family 2 domain-containing protein n=1 Tax=Cobetia sp. UIB-001 TaxID=2717697 RepID=UPI00384AA28D